MYSVGSYRGGNFLQVDPLVVLDEPGLGGLEEGGLARVVQPEDEDEVLVLLREVLVEAAEQGVHPLQDGVSSDRTKQRGLKTGKQLCRCRSVAVEVVNRPSAAADVLAHCLIHYALE